MKSQNKVLLDTSRRFLDQIKKGYVKDINVNSMRLVMIEEFDKSYGPVNAQDFDSVAKLVTELYRHFDRWLIDPTLYKSEEVAEIIK